MCPSACWQSLFSQKTPFPRFSNILKKEMFFPVCVCMCVCVCVYSFSLGQYGMGYWWDWVAMTYPVFTLHTCACVCTYVSLQISWTDVCLIVFCVLSYVCRWPRHSPSWLSTETDSGTHTCVCVCAAQTALAGLDCSFSVCTCTIWLPHCHDCSERSKPLGPFTCFIILPAPNPSVNVLFTANCSGLVNCIFSAESFLYDLFSDKSFLNYFIQRRICIT